MDKPVRDCGGCKQNRKSDASYEHRFLNGNNLLGFLGFLPAKLFKFDDARLVPDLPGDDLPGVFAIIGLDDRPAAMRAIVASPFEVMQISRRVDLFDDRIAVVCLVR